MMARGTPISGFTSVFMEDLAQLLNGFWSFASSDGVLTGFDQGDFDGSKMFKD